MPMIAMHRPKRAHPGHTPPPRSDLPPVAEAGTDAPEPTTSSSSVSWLADNDGQEVAVLSIRGDVDLATAPALRELLRPVFEQASARLVVDLSEVAFMDSTGVHFLVDAHSRLRSQNRRLAIACREHGQVHRLLALVGVLDILTVHHSRDSAVTGDDELIRPSPAGPWLSGASDARSARPISADD